MKPRTLRVLAVAAACILLRSPGESQDKIAPPATPKPISQLRWLVGGVWTADASRLGHGMQRIETRYQWSDNDAYIRFTTHFVSDKEELKNYDGDFFWDSSTSSLAMWYMSHDGEITQGHVKVEGELTELNFASEDSTGQPGDFRVQLTRKNDNLYHWTLALHRNGTWNEVLGLDYVRK